MTIPFDRYELAVFFCVPGGHFGGVNVGRIAQELFVFEIIFFDRLLFDTGQRGGEQAVLEPQA